MASTFPAQSDVFALPGCARPVEAAGTRTTAGGWIELFLAGVVIVMLTSPGLLLMGMSEDPTVPENPAFRLYWIAPYAIILGLAAWRAPKISRAWAPLLLMMAVCGWAFASRFWSIDAATTSRRVAALALTSLFGVYLGAALDSRRLVQVLAGGLTALAAGSLMTIIAVPSLGVDHLNNGGDWRGLWAEKNTLALYMALGAVVAISALLAPSRSRLLWLPTLGLCALLLAMSRGKTALLCLIIAVVVAAALWLAWRGRVMAVLTLWFAATAGSVIGFLAWIAPDTALSALGKDPTLTGRTRIWTSVMDQAAQHPLLGFGYAAFWGPTSVPALIVRKQNKWPVPSAHNGWIDLLVQIGWIGVGLFAMVFLINITANIVRAAKDGGYFGILFLTIFGVFSLTESFLEQHNNLFWALFVAVLTQALNPSASARVGFRTTVRVETATTQG